MNFPMNTGTVFQHVVYKALRVSYLVFNNHFKPYCQLIPDLLMTTSSSAIVAVIHRIPNSNSMQRKCFVYTAKKSYLN